MFVVNPRSLGLAGGVIWGVSLLLLTWVSLFTGYGVLFLSLIADVYPGFSISFFGAFVGLFWGFVDAFVFFYLLAWLYNFFEH